MYVLYKKVILHSKGLIPILCGVCLGITLSLVLAPLMDDTCQPPKVAQAVKKVQDNPSVPPRKPLNEKLNSDYNDVGDDFEPRIKQLTNPPVGQKGPKKPLRWRYASTELGIHEKLFVGVLTSRNTVDRYGIALNRTLLQFVTKLIFFMDTRGPNLPSGMSVVSFSDEKPHMKPFHVFKYVEDHYVKNYDWFFFVTDDTYVRGFKLFEMVSNMSVGHDVCMGIPDEASFCRLENGILLSQSLLMKVVHNLNWCMLKADPYKSSTDNIGFCIQQTTGQTCSSTAGEAVFSSYNLNNAVFDGDTATWGNDRALHEAFTFTGIHDAPTIYQLHRYMCRHEINITKEKLEETKQEIARALPKAPKGTVPNTWPLGVEPPSKPRTRFDVIKWDYFTETHIYLDDELTTVRKLTGVHKEDVKEVINYSLQQLKDKYGAGLLYRGLLNGYRQFDPVRGMEYILDLQVRDVATSNEDVVKRVRLLRPLNHVEIVPMPYVTESSRVNLVLPVTSTEQDGVVSFLDQYAHTCLDSGDNTHLFVVFVYHPMADQKSDIFSILKSTITYYESKYMNGARIAWTAIRSSNPTQFVIMDAISKKFPPESLFLLCTIGMELSIEFLNRVRMNTINGWQVFFPVAFWQYKPNLIYDEKPYPTTIEISKLTGHFDANSYIHASFYNADYQAGRKTMTRSTTESAQSDNTDVNDLYSMFLTHHNVHVFRAVEPALKHRYRNIVCNPTVDEESYRLCLMRRAEGLASCSQLAMLIFEHLQKLDEGQMDVLHRQQDPNVQQMKPNMLRKK